MVGRRPKRLILCFQFPPLCNFAVLCCSLQRAPAAVEAALLCLARCCASGQLQAALLSHGMLGHVVPMLLAFDATLAKADAAQQPLPSPDDATGVLRLPLLRLNVQATKNLHAQLAVRALASLAGYPPGPSGGAETQIAESEAEAREGAAAAPTPPCPAAQRALGSLMTETLAPRLREADVLPLLRDLNSTVQTPQVGLGRRHVWAAGRVGGQDGRYVEMRMSEQRGTCGGRSIPRFLACSQPLVSGRQRTFSLPDLALRLLPPCLSPSALPLGNLEQQHAGSLPPHLPYSVT